MCRSFSPTSLMLLAALLTQGGTLATPAGQVIGELVDPEHPSVESFMDILSVRIEQQGGQLIFVIETRGDIPTALAQPDDSLTFLWLVDADNNPATGQPSPGFGSEFNVRAVISEVYGGGYVDVVGSMEGGGLGTFEVQGNLIQMSIGLFQIANPPNFHWRCDSFQTVDGGHEPGNQLTDIATATPIPHTPPASVTVNPPLLMLCPSGPATGELEVEIRDAAGNPLDRDDHFLSFISASDGVATVDSSGLVTAHSVPVQFEDTPYVNVWADGVAADNAAVIRCTDTDLGVLHHTYAGDHVALHLPVLIEGVDLDQITTDFQVVESLNLAYTAQRMGVGTSPFHGGTQWFVLDVTDDPDTVPCGLSGNPIRLGWEFGKPIHNSCYIINVPGDRVPQWGVMFHEMGHNFTGESLSFREFTSVTSGRNFVYSEASATLAGMWSWWFLSQFAPGLNQTARDSIDAQFVTTMENYRQSVADYQSAGAIYDNLTPDNLDGILSEMFDAHGLRLWFDYFSTFLPFDEPLPCTLDTEAKQATWFVASMSVSAGDDLRDLFRTSYGFPIDDQAWPTVFACVEERIAARTFAPPGLSGLGTR